jgi:glycosyltransferase involved in cell wall biosynthesis
MAIMQQGSTTPRFVVVHAGARDGYHVARALSEADMLDTLVTDFMWSEESGWKRIAARLLPQRMLAILRRRREDTIPSARVCNRIVAAVQSFLLDGVKTLPFELRQRAIRSSDARLGRAACRVASSHDAGLLSYSYYAYDAFQSFPRGGVLFQVHPHPVSVRRILTEELREHPECADSLLQEWELSLRPTDFARLAEEPVRAKRFLCASSFTRRTLVENGASDDAIRVVPYGVDTVRFRPQIERRSEDGVLRLLFVGRINQRKGVKYLVQALERLDAGTIHLTICGRVVDDLSLFRRVSGKVTIRPSVTSSELVAAYQSADLFVFPSVVEGFGHVLLEALASGVPILTTTHTAGPDLITDGVEGFILEPRQSDLIAERIDWAASHRSELREMQQHARKIAETFTWERFRAGIVAASREFAKDLYGDLASRTSRKGSYSGGATNRAHHGALRRDVTAYSVQRSQKSA